MLVLDASIAIRGLEAGGVFEPLGDHDLVAPPLFWSEIRSALHESVWRRDQSEERAQTLLRRLGDAPIRERRHLRLGERAWQIANELGWAKTYDAEYVALASLLGCRLVTLDGRLRRGADRLGFVVTPAEL